MYSEASFSLGICYAQFSCQDLASCRGLAEDLKTPKSNYIFFKKTGFYPYDNGITRGHKCIASYLLEKYVLPGTANWIRRIGVQNKRLERMKPTKALRGNRLFKEGARFSPHVYCIHLLSLLTQRDARLQPGNLQPESQRKNS